MHEGAQPVAHGLRTRFALATPPYPHRRDQACSPEARPAHRPDGRHGSPANGVGNRQKGSGSCRAAFPGVGSVRERRLAHFEEDLFERKVFHLHANHVGCGVKLLLAIQQVMEVAHHSVNVLRHVLPGQEV